MSGTGRLATYFVGSLGNAILSWVLVGVLGGNVIAGVVLARPEPVLFSVVAIVIIIAPAVTFRDPAAVPPWYFVGLICLPVLWQAFARQPFVTDIVPTLALATLALLLAVDLDRFTTLRLAPWFAVVLTVLFTLAMAGLLHILRWSSDVLFGTAYLLDGRSQGAINAAVMIEFIYVAIAGLLAGAIFYRYFQRASTRTDAHVGAAPRMEAGDDVAGAALSKRLGISAERQAQVIRLMQTILVAVFAYGVMSRQIGVVTNAALALTITFIPAVLERDYQLVLEPGLVLWVTAAVFLHALGSTGLYDVITGWDHLTHLLSATVVAAAGYATVRAIHLHEPLIHLPRWAMFAFVLVFVLAMGVIWELLEFFVDQGALYLGLEPILAQYGIDDTILDLVYNVLGAIIVATWGTIYLTEVSEMLASYLEERMHPRGETRDP